MVTIITTTTKTKTEVKPFPKLMTHKYMGVVFFTEPKKGLRIIGGIWREDFDMETYEDYNEALTIKNK